MNIPSDSLLFLLLNFLSLLEHTADFVVALHQCSQLVYSVIPEIGESAECSMVVLSGVFVGALSVEGRGGLTVPAGHSVAAMLSGGRLEAEGAQTRFFAFLDSFNGFSKSRTIVGDVSTLLTQVTDVVERDVAVLGPSLPLAQLLHNHLHHFDLTFDRFQLALQAQLPDW